MLLRIIDTSIINVMQWSIWIRIDIIDNILSMMEKYAYNLEEIIEERTQQLIEETKKTDRLLYRMLPSYVTSLRISVIYVNNNLSK